jgi:hypothetical protein
VWRSTCADNCRPASPATRRIAESAARGEIRARTRILAIAGDVELQRRAEKHDHTRSIPSASLERLWERRDIDLRERTLWRLLYETAARADEVLRLNVEDLDIPAKRARTRSTGGDVDWLFFGSGSARLLPRLIAGRCAGPDLGRLHQDARSCGGRFRSARRCSGTVGPPVDQGRNKSMFGTDASWCEIRKSSRCAASGDVDSSHAGTQGAQPAATRAGLR